jgi:hypothetical protein
MEWTLWVVQVVIASVLAILLFAIVVNFLWGRIAGGGLFPPALETSLTTLLVFVLLAFALLILQRYLGCMEVIPEQSPSP